MQDFGLTHRRSFTSAVPLDKLFNISKSSSIQWVGLPEWKGDQMKCNM